MHESGLLGSIFSWKSNKQINNGEKKGQWIVSCGVGKNKGLKNKNNKVNISSNVPQRVTLN